MMGGIFQELRHSYISIIKNREATIKNREEEIDRLKAELQTWIDKYKEQVEEKDRLKAEITKLRKAIKTQSIKFIDERERANNADDWGKDVYNEKSKKNKRLREALREEALQHKYYRDLSMAQRLKSIKADEVLAENAALRAEVGNLYVAQQTFTDLFVESGKEVDDLACLYERLWEGWRAAISYIEESPCDQDIFEDQWKAWLRFVEIREIIEGQRVRDVTN